MGEQEGFSEKLYVTFKIISPPSLPVFISFVSIRISKNVFEGSILLEHLVVSSAKGNVSFILLLFFLSAETPAV